MKRFLAITMAAITVLATNSFAADLMVDGKTVNTDVEIVDDRSVLSVREIFESLGYKVDWDSESKTVIATSSNNENIEMEQGVVKTTAGLVKGTDEDGIFRYLGVPYAEAKERFVPAGEVTPWEGVKMADTYGAISPQGTIPGLNGESTQIGTDNNCQNLNVWTPGVNDRQKRSVMVWLHGGGFSTGSANE